MNDWGLVPAPQRADETAKSRRLIFVQRSAAKGRLETQRLSNCGQDDHNPLVSIIIGRTSLRPHSTIRARKMVAAKQAGKVVGLDKGAAAGERDVRAGWGWAVRCDSPGHR